MKRFLVLVALIGGVAAACGGGDDEQSSTAGGGDTRIVEVTMVDTAFEPEALELMEGETVRFVFTNDGKADHEAYIGTAQAQADHEDEMREAEDDGHGGGHDNSEEAITVEPDDTGELTYTFDEAGTFEIGCHEPGHYEAGMKMTIEVS